MTYEVYLDNCRIRHLSYGNRRKYSKGGTWNGRDLLRAETSLASAHHLEAFMSRPRDVNDGAQAGPSAKPFVYPVRSLLSGILRPDHAHGTLAESAEISGHEMSEHLTRRTNVLDAEAIAGM